MEGLHFHSPSVLLVDFIKDRFHKLLADVGDVRSTFDGVDGIHKGHLLELPFRRCDDIFPAVAKFVVHLWLLLVKVEVNIVLELLRPDWAVIQKHAALLACRATGVHDALLHQRQDVLVQLYHAKALQVWVEGDFGEILTRVLRDLRFALYSHIVLPALTVLVPTLAICAFNHKFGGEDVCQLGSVAISAASNLVLIVVVVVTCQ
mmetsp:Transcript_66692/g.159162  ORF Transcript_66692/g.159162 Transcript_66692/m.159162 type:complete len:205 (+) Transcript_66692:2695-3309(+)